MIEIFIPVGISLDGYRNVAIDEQDIGNGLLDGNGHRCRIFVIVGGIFFEEDGVARGWLSEDDAVIVVVDVVVVGLRDGGGFGAEQEWHYYREEEVHRLFCLQREEVVIVFAENLRVIQPISDYIIAASRSMVASFLL